MARATIKLEVVVVVDTEAWENEYRLAPGEGGADAASHLPELLVAGLAPQKSWGIIKDVSATVVGQPFESVTIERIVAGEDEA